MLRCVLAVARSLIEEDGGVLEQIQTDGRDQPRKFWWSTLLDSAGRLIGMNTAICSPSGAASGIGFTVPVDTLNRVVPYLIRDGHYEQPSIGIQVDERVNGRLEEATGIEGVFVLRVIGGLSRKRSYPREAGSLRSAE